MKISPLDIILEEYCPGAIIRIRYYLQEGH